MCETDTRPLKDPRILSSGLLGFLFQDSETGHWHFEPQTGLRLGSPTPEWESGIAAHGASCPSAPLRVPRRASAHGLCNAGART